MECIPEKDSEYRIKMTVVVYKDRRLVYRNELLIPGRFEKRSEARIQIRREINNRLKNSNFFVSPRVDFDLVRYTHEASCNTYLRYRILENAQTGSKNLGVAPREKV
jgi:hypothetical protein